MKTKEIIQEQQNSIIQPKQKELSTGGTATIADHRVETVFQRKLKASIDNSKGKSKILQKKETPDKANTFINQRGMATKTKQGRSTVASTPLSNQTGLPQNLKTGIENLSGFSMDDVKVHYNSSKPAQLEAHAYAQGTDIHLAPNQERHLPHEAWHIVQQKEGRVQSTKELKNKVNINDDAGLEKEADIMGAKATRENNQLKNNATFKETIQQKQVFQRYRKQEKEEYTRVNEILDVKPVVPKANESKVEIARKKEIAKANEIKNAFFLNQQKNESGSFSDESRVPNLLSVKEPTIRVSQNSNLAIEDVNLRKNQAKFFYGDLEEMNKWNKTLFANGADIRLISDTNKKIRVNTQNGSQKELVKIEAIHEKANKNKTQGLNFSVEGDCGVFAKKIMGDVQQEFNGYAIPYLQEIYNLDKKKKNSANEKELNENYAGKMHKHKHDTKNESLNSYLKERKLNEFGAPEVAEIMKTESLTNIETIFDSKLDPLFCKQRAKDIYNDRVFTSTINREDLTKGRFLFTNEKDTSKTTRIFGYHYGAVVAKDGGDYITLENYARASEKTSADGGKDFYFQMYGAEEGQSWHEEWAKIDHGGPEIFNPLSYVMAKENDTFYNKAALNNHLKDLDFTTYNFENKITDTMTDDDVKIILLKALAYANKFKNNELGGETEEYKKILKWQAYIKTIKNRKKLIKLKQYVSKRLKGKKITAYQKVKDFFGFSEDKEIKRKEKKWKKRNKRGILNLDDITDGEPVSESEVIRNRNKT